MENALYHCQWTPLEGTDLKGKNFYTFVNGVLVFENAKVLIEPIGQQLMFKR